MKNKIVCIIPARKNSKRLKLKNLKKIGKYTLVEHAILQAKKSKIFNKIYVTTDILKLKKICRKHKVEFYLRKKYTDSTSTVSMATHDLLKNENLSLKFSHVVQLMPTCPLRKSKDIIDSFKNFIDKKNKFQISVFKISWLHFSWAFVSKNKTIMKFFKNNKKIVNHNIFFPTGAVWIAKIDDFMKSKNFYGPDYKFFKINWISAIDIDTKDDFENAKLIYKSFKN